MTYMLVHNNEIKNDHGSECGRADNDEDRDKDNDNNDKSNHAYMCLCCTLPPC